VHKAIVRSPKKLTNFPRTRRIILTPVLGHNFAAMMMVMMVAVRIRVMVGVIWVHLVRRKLMQRRGSGAEDKVGHWLEPVALSPFSSFGLKPFKSF
jgi:hypothetical protein